MVFDREGRPPIFVGASPQQAMLEDTTMEIQLDCQLLCKPAAAGTYLSPPEYLRGSFHHQLPHASLSCSSGCFLMLAAVTIVAAHHDRPGPWKEGCSIPQTWYQRSPLHSRPHMPRYYDTQSNTPLWVLGHSLLPADDGPVPALARSA